MHEFKSYFQGDDLTSFICDVEISLLSNLEDNNTKVQVTELAAMIKYGSEGFPK